MRDDKPNKPGVMVFRVGGADIQPGLDRRGSNQPVDWQPASLIRLFLVVSRFEADHALTYLFCEGAQNGAQVKAFVDASPDRFRGNNVVVELAEAFHSLAQAKQRALALRTWLTNVNVVYPPVKISGR